MQIIPKVLQSMQVGCWVFIECLQLKPFLEQNTDEEKNIHDTAWLTDISKVLHHLMQLISTQTLILPLELFLVCWP